MRVRFLTSIAINLGGAVSTYAYGEELELPWHEAEALIAAGQAERAAPPSEPTDIETAVTPHPQEEQAVRLPKRAGRKGADQ